MSLPPWQAAGCIIHILALLQPPPSLPLVLGADPWQHGSRMSTPGINCKPFSARYLSSITHIALAIVSLLPQLSVCARWGSAGTHGIYCIAARLTLSRIVVGKWRQSIAGQKWKDAFIDEVVSKDYFDPARVIRNMIVNKSAGYVTS